jgi:hypothetical protein
MADLKKWHVCIKVFFKLGKNVTETFKTLKVCFGWQPMGKTEVSEWFSKIQKECDPY